MNNEEEIDALAMSLAPPGTTADELRKRFGEEPSGPSYTVAELARRLIFKALGCGMPGAKVWVVPAQSAIVSLRPEPGLSGRNATLTVYQADEIDFAGVLPYPLGDDGERRGDFDVMAEALTDKADQQAEGAWITPVPWDRVKAMTNGDDGDFSAPFARVDVRLLAILIDVQAACPRDHMYHFFGREPEGPHIWRAGRFTVAIMGCDADEQEVGNREQR